MIIALIGMTGVGKTTVGKILARKLSYAFLDTDEIISAVTQKKPAEIFAESGEQIFRNIESETLENALVRDNIVLSCGGGIILREKNCGLLKQKARVIWLVRPVEQIMQNPEILSRPPIYNKPENYANALKARESLYAQTCHLKINFSDAGEAAAQIIAKLT